MKKTLCIAVILLLHSCCLGQTPTAKISGPTPYLIDPEPGSGGGSCQDYNFDAGLVPFASFDSAWHVWGRHSFAAATSGSCIYNDNPNPYQQNCLATANAFATPSMVETGVFLSTCHVDVLNAQNAASTGTNPTAIAIAAGAVRTCGFCVCFVNLGISFPAGGISFPSDNIWTTWYPRQVSCDAHSGVTSPIIIDISGEGFHLTSAAEGVKFDFFGNGNQLQLGWTAASSKNAFLVLDRNQNGKIDNASEMFGNLTPQPKSHDPNGYAALAVFDDPASGGNGDGVIDAKDNVFSLLRLWIDANHDGISQPEELHTLPSLGVYSLNVKYKESRYTDEFGNQFRYKAKVNPNGQPAGDTVDRTSYDVFLVAAK